MSIEAMKQALEAYCKTLNPLWNTGISRTEAEGFFEAGFKASIAEAEKQEPVAWMYESVCGNNFTTRNNPPSYAKNIKPLYTHPPQRKPLTDEDIRKAKHHMVDGAYQYSFMQGVRYAEAAHGIKE